MDEIKLENITYTYPDSQKPVFKNLSLSLPKGITSLVGQNGTGKSTILLLAGGVVLPNEGRVLIQGIDAATLRDETERHKYVSFIYQNMEFETEEDIDTLLHFVYKNGFCEKKDESFIKTLIEVFELAPVLHKKTQEVSKGELQRTILAFSLLYGSGIILMDEPVFAMEQYQKERALEFIRDFAKKNNMSIFFSVHELELTEKYSEFLLLFHKKGNIQLGLTKELFTKDNLEEAFQIPYSMLKTKESLYRILLEKGKYPGVS